jgi:hypothetical protein
MSRSRRSSNRNRNGNRNGGGNDGANGRDFWGAKLPDDPEPAMIEVPDPSAMVRSLGTPPLAGNRPISEHYFAAVYGKAAGLAHALLAAEQDTAGSPNP